jgi:hypothetical protein
MDLSQTHTVLEEEESKEGKKVFPRPSEPRKRAYAYCSHGMGAPRALGVQRVTKKENIYKKPNDHRRGRTCNLLIRSQTRCHFARRPRSTRSPYVNIMRDRVGRCRKYRKRPYDTRASKTPSPECRRTHTLFQYNSPQCPSKSFLSIDIFIIFGRY